jgi:hypothetical protein
VPEEDQEEDGRIDKAEADDPGVGEGLKCWGKSVA